MRTTVILNDELLRAAKKRAADDGTSLKAVLERALRAYLTPPSTRSGYRLRWRTERGRVLPGVDLADGAALRDFLDGAG